VAANSFTEAFRGRGRDVFADGSLATDRGTSATSPNTGTRDPLASFEIAPGSPNPPDGSIEARPRRVTRRGVLNSALLSLLPSLLWRRAPAFARSDAPGAAAPEGATPEGATPEGATPEGATPEGATPDAATRSLEILLDVFANPPLIRGNGTAIDPIRPGLTIEQLRMASERSNIPIEFSRTPWQRGLYLVETGQADAIFASSYVEERTRYGVYPLKDGRPDTRRKLFDQSYCLFVREGSEVGWDGKALTNLHAPVGATPGYAVVPVLRAMGVTVEEEPSHLANLRKLAAGRLDAYAELDNQILPLLRNNKAEFDGIVALSPPVLTKPYFLMFSKIAYARAPEIAERTWDAIAEVNESAAYQDLLGSAKYAD
jgi:polar amino acid transport system substrate-binding protein